MNIQHTGKQLIQSTPWWLRIAALLLAGTAAWAVLPDNLRIDDPISSALYKMEFFQGQNSHVPLPPQEARDKLLALSQSQPQNAGILKAAADMDVQLLDFPAAENHLRLYLEKSADKDAAYAALETYYHSRLAFDAELKAILDHARSATPADTDIAQNAGPYGHYQRALQQIRNYGLSYDPTLIYQAVVDAYPEQEQPYLDYIRFTKDKQPALAQAMLEKMKAKFPNDAVTYLKAAATLLKDDQAFALLDKNYQPLWDMTLIKLLDSYAISAGRKGDYLNSLKDRLRKNPLDFDAVSRVFYSYHLAGNMTEAQSTLQDFRLLKEQSVRDGKSPWSAEELYTMTRLSHLLLNFDDEARYAYSLYMMLRTGKGTGPVTADDALYTLFQVLIAADQRPLQLGAGNIDYYKDIATADAGPGVLNGILSLIFNSADPASEWNDQKPRVIGYYNRAQALRLIQITQRDYPASPHLPAMYRDALKIYEKYGMDELLVQAGEQFFKNYPKSPETLDVAVSVADAYARMNNHDQEWKTYEFILPVAASLQKGRLIAPPTQQTSTESYESNTSSDEEESDDDESYDSEDSSGEEESPSDTESAEDNSAFQAPAPAADTGTTVTYETLLNRYISSLEQQKNHMAVVTLYKTQISSHPQEEALYENFASFLAANQLLEDESRVYQQAIQQFKEKSWYEKLARWYLRNKRDEEFETVSKQIIDTFEGTDVAAYLQNVVPSYSNPYRALYLALNQYAHFRFPYNLQFVNNLLSFYRTPNSEDWKSWEALAAEYYTLDEDIRSQYLEHLSKEGRLPAKPEPTNTVERRFAGDVEVWRAHYEDALPHYRDLAALYPSNSELNLRLADLTRSLGAFDPGNYNTAAGIREHLAKIQPSDSALWTTAGETLADREDYAGAKAYWQNILKIDPQNPDRYLEVATILWDYYLFDDALATLDQIRKIKNDPELFAFEAGAIQESRRDYEAAVLEYSKSLFQDSEEARSRLKELYNRPKMAPLVKAALEKRLTDNPQDSAWWNGVIGFYADLKERDTARTLIQRAVTGLPPAEFEKISASLKSTAAGLGFTDLQEQMLQLEVSRAKTELDRIQLTLDLARFYEAQNQDARAEAVYRDIYKSQPRSVGVINDVLAYYWRSGKYARAFEVYEQVIPASNVNYKKQYLLESARRHVERGDYEPALAAVRELSSQDPLNGEYFQLTAEIYAGQKNYAALSDHYKQGLAQLKDANLPADEKKARIAGMRRGIISADLILKDYTAALDQYIEILNRDAENEGVVREVSEFAMKYGIFDRLVDYYAATAQASPKDHRWPMMLGRLNLYSGHFETAVANFNAAIALRPERTDLRRQLADCLQRLGRYEDALTVYEKIYAMTYKDKQWLDPMSELHARLGHGARALELYALSLPADETAMDRNFALTEKAVGWNMPADAVRYGDAAMKEYAADMSQTLNSYGVQQYTEALVRSGQALRAFDMLSTTYRRVKSSQASATFDASELSSSAYTLQDVLTRAFPELIKTYVPGDQAQALDQAILQSHATAGDDDWTRNILLPLTRSAGLAQTQEELLKQITDRAYAAKDYSAFRNYRDQLRSFYLVRMAYAKAAPWLEEQWKRRPEESYREDLADIAESYRLAGMTDKELNMLREYFKFGTRNELRPEPVERYISLLRSAKMDAELASVADSGNLIALNDFLKAREKQLAIRAAEALGKSQAPVWLSIQKAMIARDFGDAASTVKSDYTAGLDLRTIGQQVETPADDKTSVLGDDWFYYATRYGEHLWSGGEKDESSLYLTADLEGQPTSGAPQASLGDFYFKEKDFARAAEHYTFATQLDTQMPDYLNRLAQALYEQNRKDEAFALWKDLISVPRAPRYELLLDSAIKYGFVNDIRKDMEPFLEKRIGESGILGLDSLLPGYLSTVPADAALPLAKRWIDAASDPGQIVDILLKDEELAPALRASLMRAMTDETRTRMMGAVGSDRESAQEHYLSWSHRYAKQLLNSGNAQAAAATLKQALESEGISSQSRDEMTLTYVRALIRTGDKAQADALAGKYARNATTEQEAAASATQAPDETRYRAAFELLDEQGLKAESLALQQELYERLIAGGAAGDSGYLGLARVRLLQGQPEEAKSLLGRMIYGSRENLDGLRSAASLMEENKKTAEAIEYRRDLAKRLKSDMDNLARLAADLQLAGQGAEAAKLAAVVLNSDLATLEQRASAARTYAQTATGLAGPPEMQAIEAVVRTPQSPPAAAMSNPYYRTFRTAVLKGQEAPSLDALLLQKYVDPEDNTLKVQLFEAYRRADRCELAMSVLDPDNEGKSGYYESSANDDGYEYYDYHNYPVERMSLEDAQTRDLALKMADCARKVQDDSSNVFYLQMALHYTKPDADRMELSGKIREAQESLNKKNEAEAQRYKVSVNLGRHA